MMKKILLFVFLTVAINVIGQEKIAEFSTMYTNVGNGITKMNIKFELYENKLVLNYLDKKTVKVMQKNGIKTSLVMTYDFKKEVNEYSEWYIYQDKSIQVVVILKGNKKPSVTIKTKDDFTGKTTEQLYFSLLN
jgi:hypothetical protein